MNEKETLNKSDIENFVQNRVWKRLVQALIDRTNDKMEDNNIVDPFKEPTRIARNQGVVDGLSFVLDFPAILLEQIEYENREEKKDV